MADKNVGIDAKIGTRSCTIKEASEPGTLKLSGCIEEIKEEHPKPNHTFLGMNQEKYDEWSRRVKCKMIRPWSVIKEAGSSENDSWSKVSIRADVFVGSNPESQNPSINSSGWIKQSSGLQDVSIKKHGKKRHADN